MSLKNASVILSYELEGSLASRGSYDYKERTTSGSMLPEDQRLFINKPAENCKCSMRIHLNEAFVNFAISDESRPNRNSGGFKAFKAYTFWRKWNDVQRLNYHVAKYATDMGAINYQFTVNEA